MIEFEVFPLKLKLIIIFCFIFIFPSITIYSSSHTFPFDHCFIVLPHLFLSRLSCCEKLHFYITSEDDSHTLLNSDYALSCHMQAAEVSAALNPVLIQGTLLLSLFHIFFSTVPPPQQIQCTRFSDYNSTCKLS